jgi:regulatory protein
VKLRKSKAEASEPDGAAIAVRLLSRREHSASELRRKLRHRGVAAQTIDALLRELAERGWQDDQRFARAYAASRVARGFGPLRIVAELEDRGIGSDQSRDAVAALAEDWCQCAMTAVRKRFGDAGPTDFRERARRIRYLQRRGFSPAQASLALRRSGQDEAE